MSPDWLLAGGLVASLLSSFCVLLQLNFTSTKSLLLHPNIGGLRTLFGNFEGDCPYISFVVYIQLTRAKVLYIVSSISADFALWWTKLPLPRACYYFLKNLHRNLFHLCTCANFAYDCCGVPVAMHGLAVNCISISSLVQSWCDWMLSISPVQLFDYKQCSAVNVPNKIFTSGSDSPGTLLSPWSLFTPSGGFHFEAHYVGSV